MKKSIPLSNVVYLFLLLCFANNLFAQNSMTGDGFGGRGWYVPYSFQVGAYSGFTVCGDSNQLYGWGGNLWSELGNGIPVSSTTPTLVYEMTNVKFYTTGYLSAAIKNDNTVWVWGDFPDPPSGFTNLPEQVLSNVKFVDAGINHVVFVKNDGTVWAAGSNKKGALGNGTTSLTPITTPVEMVGINNAVRAVTLGIDNFDYFNAAIIILLNDGTVKIAGGGGWFQSVNSTIPVTLNGLSDIVDIKGNAFAGYALKSDGSVYSFGRAVGGFPVLGLGQIANDSIVSPTKIIFPNGAAPIVALSANNDGYSCLALDSNHSVYAWGDNSTGQIGASLFLNTSTPTLVATNVIDIFAGETFSYILKSDSTLWATGKSGFFSGYGSIWMNLSNIQRNAFTQIDPTIAPMNLCTPKVFGVVPVHLLNFNGIAAGNTANLSWTSAEETNFEKYILEYSKDGIHYQSIATLAAKGPNSKYQYVHQQVSGTAYYRLRMLDRDGQFKYSEVRTLKFSNSAGFTIAPNPANGAVYVFLKSNEPVKSAQLFSMDGKLVTTIKDYKNGQAINISHLSTGSFMLKLVYQNGDAAFGRLIKCNSN